ncbi:MAG: hypothetical protein QOD99_3227 [Chthoniobacter sp.]|jgi:hypothetical protein|nr:hypothetical protein [Chthoniobacter sp.]
MKMLNPLKVLFGTAKWSRLRNVSFHQWEDAFEVEFEDGLSFLEPHDTIRKANSITPKALPISVEVEPETRSGFFVHYDNGQTAEVSWSFIRELPPKESKGRSMLDEMEETIISAIKSRRVIQFTYADTVRIVEPQTYGISTAGHPVLRGYQLSGGSKSGQSAGLKLYELAKMFALRNTGEPFSKAQAAHNQKDSAMSKVIASLPLPSAARASAR